MESETKGSKRNSKAVPKQVLTNSEYLFLFYVSKTACLWFVHEVAWGDLGIFFPFVAMCLPSRLVLGVMASLYHTESRKGSSGPPVKLATLMTRWMCYKLTSDLCRVARLKTCSRTDQPVGRTFW